MNIIDNLSFVGNDERVRRFLLPVRIVKTTGKVIHSEKLLTRKSLQIGLNESDYTVLQNGDSGEKASVLLDFGTELHGGIRLMIYHINCSGYPQVRLTFGESASEADSSLAEKNAKNDHAVRRFTVPAPGLSDQEWGQTGFRFVKIELMTKNAQLELKSALAVFVYRDYEYKGSFSCNDELINRIYDTAAYTCHLNLQNMVWDGIKRDRLVWIGDMMPESMTVHDVFGNVSIVEESLNFVREQTPISSWMCDLPSYSMWWILILWDWYLASGNKAFLEDNKDYALKLLDKLCDLVNDDGSDKLPFYFFDWPTNNTEAAKSGVRSLFRMSLDCGVLLADYFAENTLKAKCQKQRERLDLIKDEHFDVKQTAAFLALSGALDIKEASDVIVKNGTSGFSTFLLYYILRAAFEGGKEEETLSLLKEYSAEMLSKGATTFWEDFNTDWCENSGNITEIPCGGKRDIHGDCGAFCYKGFRHSLCHGWASGAVPFLTQCVLGVKIIEPGCKIIKIEPHLSGLKWVKGTFPTPFGTVYISHKVDEKGNVLTEVQAPKQVKIIKQ